MRQHFLTMPWLALDRQSVKGDTVKWQQRRPFLEIGETTNGETDTRSVSGVAGTSGSYGQPVVGGEQQMLAIGRALMTNPILLILDEAAEGLAPLIRAEIWRCLSAVKAAGQSILVIDKNLAALATIATRHHIIEKGRVVGSGTSEALIADANLVRRYPGV